MRDLAGRAPLIPLFLLLLLILLSHPLPPILDFVVTYDTCALLTQKREGDGKGEGERQRRRQEGKKALSSESCVVL
jgi:hypothetical protein